jgi:hypothetical protein
MDDLSERFRGLDQIDAPDVWSEAMRRQPGDRTEPSLARRVAVIAFATVIALGAFGIVVVALRERPAPKPIGGEGRGLTESGSTYLLSDFEVEYPVPPPWQGEGRYASVTYEARWSADSFPGEAACQLRLLDARDKVAATYDTGFSSIGAGPTESEAVIRVRGESVPVAAEGECGIGLVPDGSTEYVFSNLVVEDGQLIGDVTASEEPPLGDFACGIRTVDADGQEAFMVLDYAGGTGQDQVIALVGGKFREGAIPEIRCEPYRSEEQFKRSYWLPWVGETPVPTVSPSGSSAETGAVDEQRLGVYEAMIRKLVEPDDFGADEDAVPIVIHAKLCSHLRGSGCPGRISQPEQEALAERLGDLGPVQFVDGFDAGEEGARSILLLGPIHETPDGLRVEGGHWCGSLCAGGTMYIVEQLDSGYRVVGKDLTYGSWIS